MTFTEKCGKCISPSHEEGATPRKRNTKRRWLAWTISLGRKCNCVQTRSSKVRYDCRNKALGAGLLDTLYSRGTRLISGGQRLQRFLFGLKLSSRAFRFWQADLHIVRRSIEGQSNGRLVRKAAARTPGVRTTFHSARRSPHITRSSLAAHSLVTPSLGAVLLQV